VLYLRLIILLVGDDVPVDNKTFLVIDFVNLKIKSTQSFRYTHRGRMYIYVFIWVITHTCMSICVYTVFLKKESKGWFNISYNTVFLILNHLVFVLFFMFSIT
jgi:hypothetical protein